MNAYNDDLQQKAIDAARQSLQLKMGIDVNELYIVWFCKTLKNWKALISGPDIQQYIEVTYDGELRRTYVDIYEKIKNHTIRESVIGA